MYLKICLLILLLFPYVQKKPKAPVCAVEGQWQLDKIRSPQERADNIVWTLKVTRHWFVWDETATRKGKTNSIKHIYKMGDSSGEYESGTKWFFDVGYDENRLLVKRRFYSRAEHVQPWMDFYFEVKDHGHTLYHKRKWGKDVAVFEKDLYFRPVGKQKN